MSAPSTGSGSGLGSGVGLGLLRALLVAMALAGPVTALVAGCAAMSAVSGGVQTGVQGVEGAGQTGEQLKGLGGKAKDLVSGKKKDPNAAADDGAGDDDDRLKAKEAQINTPLNDKVDFKKGDKDDWRKFQLQGKPGIATFELFWDDDGSTLDLDVYDAFGVNIGKSPPRLDGQSVKRILVQIKKAGTFYVRVRAPSEKDRSIYSLNVKWDGPPVVVAAPPPDKDPPPDKNPGTTTPPVPVAPISPLNDPNKLQASIISAYRDGTGWVFYIDKGSSAKLRQGMTGSILEGPDGDKLVDKGDFSISQVVDGNRSIARTNLSKPPGKNKRVLINLR